MDRVQFFAFGFGTVEQAEESPIYREYRVNNLPEIFGK
jgi:hypothetical protein